MSKYKLQKNDSKYALEFRNNLKKDNYLKQMKELIIYVNIY